MLTVAFSNLLKGTRVSVNSCHPGVCNSKLCNDLGYHGHEPASKGAETPVMLAIGDIAENGQYFLSRRPSKCQFASDAAGIQKLYDYCATFP
jgi:hypothetical protein